MRANIHDLKTWPEYFAKVASKEKTFEIRFNDRDYRVNDTLRLIEFDPCRPCGGKGMVETGQGAGSCRDCGGSGGKYTGQSAVFVVTYVLDAHEGIRAGYVILGLREFVPDTSGALVKQPTQATRDMTAAAFMRMGEWIAKGGRLVQGTAKAGSPHDSPNLLRIQCDMTIARPEEDTPRILVS